MEKFILSVGDLSSISIYTDIEKVSKKLSETNQIKKNNSSHNKKMSKC